MPIKCAADARYLSSGRLAAFTRRMTYRRFRYAPDAPAEHTEQHPHCAPNDD
jgi:hypothetical protein